MSPALVADLKALLFISQHTKKKNLFMTLEEMIGLNIKHVTKVKDRVLLISHSLRRIFLAQFQETIFRKSIL